MAFSQLPLCSSWQLVSALERLGCYQGRTGKGSHVIYFRKLPNRTVTAAVVLGRNQVPKGTLRRILDSLEISPDEFRAKLR